MDEIQTKIEELNALLAGSQPYELAFYKPNEMDPLEVNARYMRNDTFAQLVSNVKRDKGLTSAPLVYAGPDVQRPRILSGNHRTKAAIAAGQGNSPILCLAIRQHKTAEEQVAIQLSHNSIEGADDLQILKKLYDEVSNVQMKAYSGLDEETIKQLNAIKFQPISEPRLVFKTVSLLFLPAEDEEMRAMISQVDKLLGNKDTYVLQVRDYQEFFNRLADAKQGLKITNSATALLELMRAGMAKITADLEAEKVTDAKA